MKTLFTSFAGGFGRTIGRIFALLVLGFVALKLLTIFDIDISKFTNILFLNVKAASSDDWTELLDLTDTHLYEGDMYSYIEFCNNYNQDSCAVAGRNIQSDYGWTNFTVNFNTNYLRVYNNHVILKTTKKYRLVIQQTGNTWTPVNSRYFITLNSVGGTNLYSSNSVYSNPDNTIFIEFTPLNNNDILDMYIRTTTVPNYFWLASGTKNFTVVRLDELVSQSTDNSQEIIDNATQNTQDIINNQNQNTQDIQDSINNNLNSCHQSRNIFVPLNNYLLKWADGTLSSFSGGAVSSDFVSCSAGSIFSSNYCTNIFFYDSNKNYIGNLNGTNIVTTVGTCFKNITVPNNNSISYCKFSIRSGSSGNANPVTSANVMVNVGSTLYSYEPPNQEICSNKIDDVNSSINDVNSSINNDNVDSNTGTSFFNNFEDEDFGLSEIITIPLDTIEQLTQTACVPLVLPIPFTNRTVSLPCMTQVYEQHISAVYNIWKVVSFGIIAYMIAIDIFHMVKGFKDPESDKVEVLDL